MSSYKICDYCGEYEHDCSCLAAKRIAKLEKDRNHFKQLAEERWKMCEELIDSLTEHRAALYAIATGALNTVDAVSLDNKANAALSHFHSLQQPKKDE